MGGVRPGPRAERPRRAFRTCRTRRPGRGAEPSGSRRRCRESAHEPATPRRRGTRERSGRAAAPTMNQIMPRPDRHAATASGVLDVTDRRGAGTPVGTVAPCLVLPDRHRLLQRVDDVARRVERSSRWGADTTTTTAVRRHRAARHDGPSPGARSSASACGLRRRSRRSGRRRPGRRPRRELLDAVAPLGVVADGAGEHDDRPTSGRTAQS